MTLYHQWYMKKRNGALNQITIMGEEIEQLKASLRPIFHFHFRFTQTETETNQFRFE